MATSKWRETEWGAALRENYKGGSQNADSQKVGDLYSQEMQYISWCLISKNRVLAFAFGPYILSLLSDLKWPVGFVLKLPFD